MELEEGHKAPKPSFKNFPTCSVPATYISVLRCPEEIEIPQSVSSQFYI